MIHVNVEDNFYIKNRTVRHGPTDMRVTLEQLRLAIRQGGTYKKNPGSKANAAVDMFAEGLSNYVTSKIDLVGAGELEEGGVQSMADTRANLDAV